MKLLKDGDYVLVQGTGGVSLCALQFAKAAGACIVAITSAEEKAKKLRNLGANHVINYGAGFDHIVEGHHRNDWLCRHARTVSFMNLLLTICTLRGIYVENKALMRDMARAVEVHSIHSVLDNKVFKFEEVKETGAFWIDARE